MVFTDRREASMLLVKKLMSYKRKEDVIILGLPRGGVEMAYHISKELRLPFDILVIRKIGLPENEEFSIGAASVDDYFINPNVLENYTLSKSYIDAQVKEKQEDAIKMNSLLRGDKPFPDLNDKIVILVDDGIATGASMMLAIEIVRKQGPSKIIVAFPVGPEETINKIRKIADEVICLEQPENFIAVGLHYKDFEQLDMEKVRGFLENGRG